MKDGNSNSIKDKLFKLFSDFTSTKKTTAGKSPSQQMTYNEDESAIRYQVKQSNSINTNRKLSGYDPDCADIVGEAIASQIASNLLNKPDSINLSPDVSFVYKQDTQQILIASQYLNDGLMTDKKNVSGALVRDTVGNPIPERRVYGFTLDELMQNRISVVDNQLNATSSRHALISAGKSHDPKDGRVLPLGEDFYIEIVTNDIPVSVKVNIDKREIYEGLKISFLLHDHDVNPGNFYAMYDKETNQLRTGRIDYGHALNDLIKSMNPFTPFAPKLENNNSVLDALNRKGVNGGTSKFQRDFSGVVEDPLFASVMKEGYGAKEMDIMYKTIDAAMSSLKGMHEAGDKNLKNELESSLISINKRLGNHISSKELKNLDPAERFDFLFKKTSGSLTLMVNETNRDIKLVGAMLETQQLVAQTIKGEITSEKAAAQIKQLQQEFPELTNKKIEWVKTELDSKPIKGSLDDYIKIEGAKIAKAEGIKLETAEFKGLDLKREINAKQPEQEKSSAQKNTSELEKTTQDKQPEQKWVKGVISNRNADQGITR